MGEDSLIDGLETVQVEFVEELALTYRRAFKRLVQWTVAMGAISVIFRLFGGLHWVTPAGVGVFTSGMAVAAKAGADKAEFQALRVRNAAELKKTRNALVYVPQPADVKVH